MNERNNFTELEDFLSNESFRQWVRYNNDEQKWEEWTLENSERAKLVQEARALLLAMKVPKADEKALNVNSALITTWSKIKTKENNDRKVRKLISKIFDNRTLKIAVAASIFGILIGSFYYRIIYKDSSISVYSTGIIENDEGLVQQTNNSKNAQIITLSDGSSVLLQPKSKLSYPKTFLANERRVYLLGEGFFEISKDSNRPFFVCANEIVTKVVGTSFKIRAYNDQPNIEVVVRTGKVKISSNESKAQLNKDEIILLPNQALRFTRKKSTYEKITDITTDKSILQNANSIEQLSFNFSDTPISQILKTIEQAYLVEIDFPEEKLKNCHLTTSLNDEPLPEKLKIICKSLGKNTSYQMNGNQINITSEGCN